jgi:hypothetical protein
MVVGEDKPVGAEDNARPGAFRIVVTKRDVDVDQGRVDLGGNRRDIGRPGRPWALDPWDSRSRDCCRWRSPGRAWLAGWGAAAGCGAAWPSNTADAGTGGSCGDDYENGSGPPQGAALLVPAVTVA